MSIESRAIPMSPSRKASAVTLHLLSRPSPRIRDHARLRNNASAVTLSPLHLVIRPPAYDLAPDGFVSE
jgi:hypothetical protein